MKRQKRVWTARGLEIARPLTEQEKREKNLECARKAGELAIEYISRGCDDLAAACARNAASAALNAIGRFCHVDISNSPGRIEPPCRDRGPGDSFVFGDKYDSRDMQEAAKHVDCPSCIKIIDKLLSGAATPKAAMEACR